MEIYFGLTDDPADLHELLQVTALPIPASRASAVEHVQAMIGEVVRRAVSSKG